MRKIIMIGIFAILLGFVFVFYSVFQFGLGVIQNDYLFARGIMILGFVMMAGGALVSLSPFGKR